MALTVGLLAFLAVDAMLEGDPDVQRWSTYVGQGAIRFYLPLDAQLAIRRSDLPLDLCQPIAELAPLALEPEPPASQHGDALLRADAGPALDGAGAPAVGPALPQRVSGAQSLADLAASALDGAVAALRAVGRDAVDGAAHGTGGGAAELRRVVDQRVGDAVEG